jgi:HD-GYP domain-containing protein (c-di-GMP phosphodiesterase class II)
MITPRPYRAAMSREEALAELRAGAGTRYDPDVVDALLDLLGEHPPDGPDRSLGVRLPPPPPEAPARRRRARSR